MTRRFILHIGTEKTGSTAIQSFLRKNRDQLGARNCLYPATLGDGPHFKLTSCCVDFKPGHPMLSLIGVDSEAQQADYFRGILTAFRGEVEKRSADHVIISDEHIKVHLSSPVMLGNGAQTGIVHSW